MTVIPAQERTQGWGDHLRHPANTPRLFYNGSVLDGELARRRRAGGAVRRSEAKVRRRRGYDLGTELRYEVPQKIGEATSSMRQITDYSDSRNKAFCIHCGGWLSLEETTRDHVPTKGLLNPPYHENLPVVNVCRQCNSGFGRDEEYVIAFLGSVLSGSTRPGPARFPKAAGILSHSTGLRNRIDRSQTSQKTLWGDSEIRWKPEMDRIHRVTLKNARGHVMFELGEPMLDQPSQVSVQPIPEMTSQQVDQFESVPHGSGWPEVGSRMLQRVVVVHAAEGPLEAYSESWQDVQDGVYRYAVSAVEGCVLVRTVIHEYLATEVTWSH